MAIASLNDYIASVKQSIAFTKSASVTTIAGIPYSMFAMAGYPVAGVLAVGDIVAGIVPTDITPNGYPNIATITNTGYISRIEYQNTVAAQFILYDRVFSAGAFGFGANVTLAGQPSYLSRMPGGNYSGTELWLETVTAFTGLQTIQITYLDQGGLAGDTGAVLTAVAPTVARMFRVPLAAGDNGISQVNNITSTIATAGTFNVHVMRPLCSCFVVGAGYAGVLDMLSTGLPRIYDNSALFPVIRASGVSSGLPSLVIEIADG